MQSKGRTLAKTHIRQHTSTKNKSDNCSINNSNNKNKNTHTHKNNTNTDTTSKDNCKKLSSNNSRRSSLPLPSLEQQQKGIRSKSPESTTNLSCQVASEGRDVR